MKRTLPDNLMSSPQKTIKTCFIEPIKLNLLTIQEIKQRFKSYKDTGKERYSESIVWFDVGAMFFLLYISEKYKPLIQVNFTIQDIIDLNVKGVDINEKIQNVDILLDEEKDPKFLIYYKKSKFYFDKNLISPDSEKLQVFILSHSFESGTGHLGCLFVHQKRAYYYDANGLKDRDEAEYYNIFEKQLSKVLYSEYQIVYYPYKWKTGIQTSQNNEECKYKMDIMGMCCAWTYLIIELKLLNPQMTIETIEQRLRLKYRNRLTRMIVSYQQKMHSVLFDFAKSILQK